MKKIYLQPTQYPLATEIWAIRFLSSSLDGRLEMNCIPTGATGGQLPGRTFAAFQEHKGSYRQGPHGESLYLQVPYVIEKKVVWQCK